MSTENHVASGSFFVEFGLVQGRVNFFLQKPIKIAVITSVHLCASEYFQLKVMQTKLLGIKIWIKLRENSNP